MTRVEVESHVNKDGKRVTVPVGDVPTESPANFLNFGTSGVTYYRTLLPAQEVKASVYIRDSVGMDPRLVIGPQDTPVVVYSMPRLPFMFEEVAELMSKGVKVIADVDDYLRAFMGKEDVKDFEKYTEEYVGEHEQCLQVCDLVTCSTAFIADELARIGCDTVVVPNGIDRGSDRWAHTNREYRRERGRDKVVWIGWSGSVGHTNAFKAIVPQLERVLRENDHVRFASVGLPMMEHIAEDLHDKCVALPFVMFPEHPKSMSQFHINIGPTLPDDFYRSKSDLRLQEAWAAGQCFVGGPETYGGSISEGVNGFVCEHGSDDWYDKLSLLVRDRDLRNRVGRNGLVANRTIAATGVLWKQAIESVL